MEALEKASEWGERIPIGIIYTNKRVKYDDYILRNIRIPLMQQTYNKKKLKGILRDFEI
jgi:hypothetical protein